MSGARGTPEPGSGHTWWGRAWVDALEQRAQLDPNRLPRGKDYARTGAVGELALAPGEARARVQGRKRLPYDIRIRVRRFTDDEWGRVLDLISAQLGRAAAMLDGDLPPDIADDVAAAGLDLLPGAGEIGPRCSCPDDADPCKHAAAVCYLVADALDADPFVVLLLRGRTRGGRCLRACDCGAAARISSGPRRLDPRRRTASRPTAQRPAARMRTAQRRTRPPATGGWTPEPFWRRHRRPGRSRCRHCRPGGQGIRRRCLSTPPPWRSGLRDDLRALASDAAQRAWQLAVGLDADAGMSLDADADLARRAELTLGTPAFSALAERSGIDGHELARRGLAWRHGGPAGLELLHVEWDPDTDAADAADLLKAARVALRDASGTTARLARNRITAGRAQLRLGRDLLWYPYSRSDDDWEPAGPPQSDPARAAESL